MAISPGVCVPYAAAGV